MRISSTYTILSALLLSQNIGAFAKPSKNIKWGSCHRDLGNLTKVECGNLTVPLDYTDDSDKRTITLRLIKSPAKKQPAPKGSILLNYGGPGQDGVNSFLKYFVKQRKYIGEDHDMISWDPRATRDTLPANCINVTDPLTAPLQSFGTYWHDASEAIPGQNWAEATVISDICHAKLRDIGPYVGMAASARDAMSIVDALDEDGMLRYWGLSGGTTLGSTAAAMFPDRMDKVILDGVMNVKQYYHDFVETEWFSDSDNAFRSIMDACAELGPKKCPIARANMTGEALVESFGEIFEDLKTNPIPVSLPKLGTGSLIDYSTVIDYVYTRLYAPPKFQYLIGILDAVQKRNGTQYSTVFELDQQASPKLPSEDKIPSAQFAPSAIRCGDRFPRTDNAEDVEKTLAKAHKISPMFGYFGANLNAQLCAQWKFKSVERYEGNFEVTTKNPILFVSNTYDPATPLVSAKNISSGFEGSRVLEQESIGHVTFMTQESNCTRDALLEYLADGTLPKKGTKCKPNLPATSYVSGEFEGLDHV